ncbi:MAG: hypothetical protein K2I20_06570 [Clostridia bacterium]|nr:hypothetical protein [Clostridia bacterium]
MRKFVKISMTGLMLLGIAGVGAGCLGTPPKVEVPEGGDKQQTVISDAYDYNDDKTASTRPTIPGGYYEPQLPITEVKVTIAESSNITFADGSREKLITLGVPLTTADFDQSTLGGHEVGGFAVLDENGGISTFNSLTEFAPQSEVTVMPYYAAENGEYLQFSSNGIDYTIPGGNGGDGGLKASAFSTSNAIVAGYRGTLISYNGDVSANNWARFKSAFAREADAEYTYYYTFVNEGETAVSFTAYQMNALKDITSTDAEMSDHVYIAPGQSQKVIIGQNINKQDGNAMMIIKFDQSISGGFSLGVVHEIVHEIERKDAQIHIVLPNGVSEEEFSVKDTYNRNVTTFDSKLILPTADQVENHTGENLMGWRYENGGIINEGVRIYGDVYITPVFPADVTVSVRLPQGLTLNGYNAVTKTGEELVLPTDEQIGVTESNYGSPYGWYNYDTGAIIQQGATVEGDITIAPYWQTANGYEYVAVGGAQDYGYNTDEVPSDFYDYSTKKLRGSATYQGKTANGAAAKLIDFGNYGSYLGSVISDTAAVRAGSAMRLDSVNPTKFNTEKVVEYSYFIRNMSATENLAISIYQIRMSSEYKSSTFYQYESRYCVSVNLAPNTSTKELGQYLLTGGNDNALTYIVFEQDVSSFSFGISIGAKILGQSAVDEAYDTVRHPNDYSDYMVTMSYDKNEYGGLEVNDNYLTQHAGRLLLAPSEGQYTHMPFGEILEKWVISINDEIYDLPTTRTYTGIRLPSSGEIKLIPVFKTYFTVTISMPSDGTVRLKDFDSPMRVYEGGHLTLPTNSNLIIEEGYTVAGWRIAGTETRVTNDTYPTDNMIIEPIVQEITNEPVTMTLDAATPEGFTVADSYLNKWRVGATLSVPAADEYTNTLNKRLTGWTVTNAAGTVLIENRLTDTFYILTDADKVLTILPTLVDRITINTELPSGFTLNGYNPDVVRGETITLPTSEQITNNTGRTLAGWFNKATGRELTNSSVLTGIDEITIAPYFNAPAGKTSVVPGSRSGGATDYAQNISVTRTANTSIVGGDAMGVEFTSTSALSGNNGFRLVSAHRVTKDIRYKYTVNITNYGTNAVSFNIKALNNGTPGGAGGAASDTGNSNTEQVSLVPGASASVELTITITTTNDNVMLWLSNFSGGTGFKLGMSMWLETV